MSGKVIISFFAAMAVIVSCTGNKADTVVYGSIRTADPDSPLVEAFAVKNGKFVYVGDKAGAAAFIREGSTEVIDHSGKGMVIPGCYESHGHYIMGNTIPIMGGLMVGNEDSAAEFLEKLKAKYDETKAAGRSDIYGFGWNYVLFSAAGEIPTIQQLDAICPDVSVYINDSEGHKGLANSVCLRNAGIIDENGNVLKPEIRGGVVFMDGNGKPTGLLSEQAGTYVRCKGVNFDDLLPVSLAAEAVKISQEMLNSKGYVSYMDGWSNYFGNDNYYEAAEQLDKEGKLSMLLGLSYEIESSCDDIEKEIDEAGKVLKYTKGHINAHYVKLFIDGTVESGTGLLMEPYKDGSYGIANWDEDEVTEITRLANEAGCTMHIHTMGDGAVNRAVNAFEKAGTREARNTLVHVRNILDEDIQRVADNDIAVAGGIHWHCIQDEIRPLFKQLLPEGVRDKSYPMKSFFDHGAKLSSHTDFPATSGSPSDPFGIMEIAMTGSAKYPGDTDRYTQPWWTEELLTLDQALQALTINGAWQMHVENERGSIKVGKYADFVLADTDVYNCPVKDIHKTKVLSTWFEGKKVYQAE